MRGWDEAQTEFCRGLEVVAAAAAGAAKEDKWLLAQVPN